jgi:hypothetical protein
MNSSNFTQNRIRIYYCCRILYIHVDIFANNFLHAVIYIVTSVVDADLYYIHKYYCGKKSDHNISLTVFWGRVHLV